MIFFPPIQLHSVLKTLRFNNNAGEEIFLDEKAKLVAGFDIINFYISPNDSFHKVQVGRIDPQAPAGKEFVINGSNIVWNQVFNQMPPRSTCVESCHPGQSMFVQPEKQVCCYDCVQCPAGRISIQSDAEQCQECPEDKYPNENHNQCLPKKLNYLSYGEPLGAALAFASLFLSTGTAMVMRTFIRHRDTPIVKANNWSITCTLLSSLLICFLCPLLFIGCPGKVTCLLRQMVFGIIFTLAVACILAKTITVLLAFMATKPGNRARNWIGKRPAVLVIVPSSFLQVGICGVWLAMAHPFLELDIHSQRDEILLECNDGSPLMFYMVLGYMGLLAIISFLVAFSARKLPDTFNEAKLITFSMLVFCSVWISFVPTYLSTKGKYMVAVEIFSILASGAGLLGYIFLPKLYIIILRPELNTRKHLVRRQDCFQVEQSCH
uniref:Vomeronasal type-2 receptor 26-like n=1 Tax=Pogona vitticeps TaxID=103695 RepID=A0ABM5EIQ4_9SAUR